MGTCSWRTLLLRLGMGRTLRLLAALAALSCITLPRICAQPEPATPPTSPVTHASTGISPFSSGLPVRETVWRRLVKERDYDMSDPPNWGKGTTFVSLKFKLNRIV